ncbi:MAG: MFS transporter [Eubacterium sp.]|nr:MFS transporter [Eubacterium sp.]
MRNKMDSKREVNKAGGFWTLRYTLINALYFSAFCTLHALAAVYLLANGFTNTEVGILLAVANITSALCQPLFAGIIDKQGWLTNRRYIFISAIMIMLGSILLMFAHDSKVVVFIVYALIYMIQFAYQPVVTALYFEYEKYGCKINFGLARGLGSASFAVTSAFIGGYVERSGVSVLLVVNVITMILTAIIIYFFKNPSENTDSDLVSDEVSKEMDNESDDEVVQAHNNILDFVKTYPAYAIFLIAVICFFFAHNMINDFMIQIIRSLGGAEKELGYSNFLQAILELPVMALFALILKKISAQKLLIISGIAFFIKILILIFATNMTMMYISQSCQLFAYALFIPAAAYYVNESMSEHDQVKGQAFVTSAITMGGVFSNLISGVILDNLGIKEMLMTGTIVAALGVIVIFYAMNKKSNSK